jgi:hypothetical protein
MTNSSATFNITGVQVEVGPTMTDFEHREYGGELLRCLRYYWRHTLGVSDNVCQGHVQSTTLARCIHNFPVEMRSDPTLEVSGVADFTIHHDSGTATDTTNITASVTSTWAMRLQCTVASGLTVGQGCALCADGSTGRYIAMVAEL